MRATREGVDKSGRDRRISTAVGALDGWIAPTICALLYGLAVGALTSGRRPAVGSRSPTWNLPQVANLSRAGMISKNIKGMRDRFKIIQDPLDRWMVWDREKNAPAFFAGTDLVGLNQIKAEAAARILNNIDQSSMKTPDHD